MRVMEHAFVTPRRAERGLGGRQCRKKAYRTSRVCCDAVSGVVKRHRVVHGAKDAAWKPLASALCARFQGAFGRAPWTTSSFARCKCTRVLFMPLRPLAGTQNETFRLNTEDDTLVRTVHITLDDGSTWRGVYEYARA